MTATRAAMDTDPLHVSASFDAALADATERRDQGRYRPRGTKTGTGRGRHTRLNAKLIERIAELVRKGRYVETACAEVGINKATFYNWKAAGEEVRAALQNGMEVEPGRLIYLDFLDAVEQAAGEALGEAVEVHRNVALGGTVLEVEEWEDSEGVTHRKAIYTPPNAKALEWWMERTNPRLYGRRVALGNVTDEEGRAIPLEVEVSARDLVKRKLGMVASRLGTEDEGENDG